MLSTILGAAGEYAVVIVQYIVRITTIFLAGLGTVYIPTRQLGMKIPVLRQHLIALIAMLVSSTVITAIYHYTTFGRFLWESIVFWIICNVVYVVLGQHFYNRIDNFLDKKLGED
jgi:uncharacterized membrane protein YfcA